MVAACTGHALAAGALLLLGCDVRVGADIDCKIGLNEVAIGLVLPDWALTIAAERLSRRHLQMAVATARVTDAEAPRKPAFSTRWCPRTSSSLRRSSAPARCPPSIAVPMAAPFRALRGPTLDRMEQQIANDRRLLSSPGAVVGRSQQVGHAVVGGSQLPEHVASRPFGAFVASACSIAAVSRHKGDFGWAWRRRGLDCPQKL